MTPSRIVNQRRHLVSSTTERDPKRTRRNTGTEIRVRVGQHPFVSFIFQLLMISYIPSSTIHRAQFTIIVNSRISTRDSTAPI